MWAGVPPMLKRSPHPHHDTLTLTWNGGLYCATYTVRQSILWPASCRSLQGWVGGVGERPATACVLIIECTCKHAMQPRARMCACVCVCIRVRKSTRSTYEVWTCVCVGRVSSKDHDNHALAPHPLSPPPHHPHRMKALATRPMREAVAKPSKARMNTSTS